MTGDTPAPAGMRNEYAADLGLTETDLAPDWHTARNSDGASSGMDS